MIKISAIILAKNAERIIKDCLDSVSFCDEIIVVDSNSTDTTRDIAEKCGARVIEHLFENFAEQRNVGLKEAKGEWILYVDTDERVTSSLREEIDKYTHNPTNKYNAYKIKRKNFYLGNNEWPKTEKLERLFKKGTLRGWYGNLHESPIVTGDIGELDGFLVHYTHTDLKTMLDKTIIWSKVESENRFQAHHPQMTWWRFPRVMIPAFGESYCKQGGWKAGTAGLIESMYQMFSMFVTFARLWELQSSHNHKT